MAGDAGLNVVCNQRIPSQRRATVLSIKNMVNSILFMTLSPLIGRMIDSYSLNTALFWMALTLVAVSLLLFIVYGHRSRTLSPAQQN